MHMRSSKLPRSTEPSQKKHRTVDSDPGFDAEERGSSPVRKRRGRPPKAKPAGHEKNDGPALDAGGGEVRLSPTEGVVEGGDGLIRRRRGRPPKAEIRQDGGGVLRLEDLEGKKSVGEKVVQDGDVSGQANAAMEISTSLHSRDESKGNSLELSKRVTSDEDKSLLPQKKSKKEATEGISGATAFQEVTSGGETLREMSSQYQMSDLPNTQVRLRGKMRTHRRNPSLINSRTKQRQARTEGDLKVHKNHNVRKPEEQLGNVGDEQLNEKLHAPQTEPVTPVGLWDKDLQTQERTSVIRSEEMSNEATQNKGDEIIHEEQQKSPHQSSHDKVTKPEEQLGSVGDEQLNEKLHVPQTEPVTLVGLWDKDLQTEERTSVIRSEEISNEATQNKGDEIIHEEQQKSPHQSSHDKVTKPEEQLGSVGDEQLNEELHAPQTEPVTPVGLWDKDLQTQERTSVIRSEEISNEATQNKGDEIIHEEQQKSPHQSSHDMVTKSEEQLGSVGVEQLNEKLHAPQTEPVTPIALWDKDLQTQERASVIRLEEISNEATQKKGDEIIHEEKQKSPHQSSEDHDEQRKVEKANAVNPSFKELSLLPFVKISPMWEMMESNVVFITIPQSPHFQPLEQCSEVFREGMAIGHMVTFANMADAICKLHLGDHRSAFENMLKDLAELERHGFDCQLLRVRIQRLLWLKDSFLQSEDKLVETEEHIRGQQHQKENLNTEIDTLNRDIAILQEKRASVIETRKETEENIEQLQQEVQKAKGASHLAEEDFKKVAAAPWST